MEERIIRLPELITYHQINEVWEESIACFCTKSDMKNISKIPPCSCRHVFVYSCGGRYGTLYTQL